MGARPGSIDAFRRIAGTLIALALFVRILVPAGFMPTGDGFAVSICTGMGVEAAWVDTTGKLHKGELPGKTPADQTCAFAGAGAALDTPPLAPPIVPLSAPRFASTIPSLVVGVGRGLAAPPPPATGPPAIL